MKIVRGIIMTILLILLIGVSVITLSFIGVLFRAYAVVFFIIWIIVPIFVIVFRHSKYGTSISKKTAKWIWIVLMTLAVGISVFTFVHFDFIRDGIGYKNIKGYHSEYYPDVDDFGLPTQGGVDVHTSHWFGQFVLWVFEWGYIILCIGIPIITWKQCSTIYDKIPDDTGVH